MREQQSNSVSHLRALIELFDLEWHRFSFPSYGFWRNRGWEGPSSGCELNFYTRGENTVTQDNRTISFKQGDLFYAPDTIRLSACSDGSFDLYYLGFQFDSEDLNERMRHLLDQLDIGKVPLSMPGLQADFRVLMTELRMNREISIMAKLYFLQIFMKLYTNQVQSTGSRNKNEQIVRQVIEDIQERVDDGGKILLPAIAKRHSLNERYLNLIFKSVTGTTIGKYILSIRIERAKRLLETTSMPITEIAIATGFYDGAHFSKAFKASEKVTPQEYHKQHAYL
ncbi:AraC family transcriptional regulator [Paenibacillus spongiae]|uniref:Helix-turn-helix transcriptional regulator n=1 Tax=Paenibacillus spongiae TaxID=2909671 RepID=A0ABY5SHR0_9BACL|nr:AraC family transcriptional regulator [Paenibacillus spongiae]UVI33194.1 helix-turn-helix transcriptional regulator [Paenibacillus spongiae]